MTLGSVRRILPHGADGESPEHLGAREERAMAEILGTGTYRYEVVNDWAKLPPGQEFNADVAAVGVDAQDRVYAFNRGRHPVVVLDREGNFLRSWGEGVFHRAHGYGNARVHKYSPDGWLLLSWGEPGTDPGQFNIPHNICCDADGWVYVA